MPLSICESDRRRAKDMGEDRREEIQAYEESRETPEKKGEQERVPEPGKESQVQENTREAAEETQKQENSLEAAETEDDGSSYEFMKETIKAKPLDKKKIARQAGKLVGSGAVFGLAAALVFGALAPAFLEEARARKSAQEVQFQNSTEETEKEQEDTQEEEQEDTQEQTTIIQEMTPEDYQTLYADIFSTAQEAERL